VITDYLFEWAVKGLVLAMSPLDGILDGAIPSTLPADFAELAGKVGWVGLFIPFTLAVQAAILVTAVRAGVSAGKFLVFILEKAHILG